MNISLGVGALSFGLISAACLPNGSETTHSPASQVNRTTNAPQALSAREAVPAPQWTCTITGAGIVGTCVNI